MVKCAASASASKRQNIRAAMATHSRRPSLSAALRKGVTGKFFASSVWLSDDGTDRTEGRHQRSCVMRETLMRPSGGASFFFTFRNCDRSPFCWFWNVLRVVCFLSISKCVPIDDCAVGGLSCNPHHCSGV